MNAETAQQPDLKDLYRELIMDHARSPRHRGRLANPTHRCDGINPLCGDKLEIHLRVASDDTIADVGFEGSGCAISIASASLMTDTIIGRRIGDAEAIADSVTTGLQIGFRAGDNSNVGKIKALEGVREFPSRVKCATLAWQSLRGALHRKTEPVSTE